MVDPWRLSNRRAVGMGVKKLGPLCPDTCCTRWSILRKLLHRPGREERYRSRGLISCGRWCVGPVLVALGGSASTRRTRARVGKRIRATMHRSGWMLLCLLGGLWLRSGRRPVRDCSAECPCGRLHMIRLSCGPCRRSLAAHTMRSRQYDLIWVTVFRNPEIGHIKVAKVIVK